MTEDAFAMARRMAAEKEGPISREIFKGTPPMTEEELVEKVAKAIYDQEYNYFGCDKWETAAPKYKLPIVTAARAAIAAMREAGWGPSPFNVVFMTDKFLELLDNPPDPNEALKRLMGTSE